MTVVHTGADKETEHGSIRTTLYDLIAAINSEVGPDEEELVIATMVHLLSTGRIRLLREEKSVYSDTKDMSQMPSWGYDN